jgi:hypothetical protein
MWRDTGLRYTPNYAFNSGKHLRVVIVERGAKVREVFKLSKQISKIFLLRRRGDSNPRYRYQYGSLANCWFQPLTHPSGTLSAKEYANLQKLYDRAIASPKF